MSENYLVSARKYRPSTFGSVVGQASLTRTLRNAVVSDRLAQAYLFCGPRGVGKTSCARIFAKTINCEHRTVDGEACGECDSCRDFQRGVSYNVVELDAASNNGVNEMKSLIEQVNVPPQTGRYRVFIIDEVHMLSSQAFNAFLKTLEEPPRYAVFVMATTEKNKVLPTILSRCQIFDFSRITDADISAHLQHVAEQEGIESDALALDLIARKADGAMRDALSIFDQVAAASGNRVTYESTLENLNILDFEYYFRFAEAFRTGNVEEALVLYKDVRDRGFDAQFFINGLAMHLRNLLVALSEATVGLLEVAERLRGRYMEQARMFNAKWYYGALKILSDADLNYRIATDKQLLVELSLIRLCQLGGGDGSSPTGGDTPRLRNVASAPALSAGVTASPSASPSPSASGASVSLSTASVAAGVPVGEAGVRGSVAEGGSDSVGRRGSSRVRHGVASVRLNSVGSASKPEVGAGHGTPEAGASAGRSVPITPEGVERAWRAYASAHPKDKILVQAMQSLPASQGDGVYLLVVGHQGMAREVEVHAQELCSYMRDQLRNDSFTLRIEIREVVHKVRLQPRELLQESVVSNPDMRDFIESLELELE